MGGFDLIQQIPDFPNAHILGQLLGSRYFCLHFSLNLWGYQSSAPASMNWRRRALSLGLTLSACIWLIMAMTSRMFTRGIHQAASTDLSSSWMCGNTVVERIPNQLKDKRKTAVGQEGQGLLTTDHRLRTTDYGPRTTDHEPRTLTTSLRPSAS